MLAADLATVLASIEVAPDCRSATVSGRAIEASGPAELVYRLSRAIYEVHHVGWPQAPADRDLTGQDNQLEERLVAAIPHRSVHRAGKLLSASQDRDYVEIDGVKVAFPRCDVGRPAGQGDAGDANGLARFGRADDVLVRLPSWRPALSPGYLVADGTRALAATAAVLRCYVHLRTCDALVHTWHITLAALEEHGAGYRAKVTSIRGLLPRRDALVVYLAAGDQAVAALIADRLGRIDGDLGPGQDTSAFTERAGPGVAIAWEPCDHRPAMRGLSFGEHRARAVAEGLLAHAGSGRAGSAADEVCRALLSAGIDPACPARNLPA